MSSARDAGPVLEHQYTHFAKSWLLFQHESPLTGHDQWTPNVVKLVPDRSAHLPLSVIF